MDRTNPIVSANQNFNWRGDRVGADNTDCAERSDALRGKAWGRVNSEVGGRTANYEEFAFGLGIIKNYFTSFFDLEESPILGFVVRALTGSSDFLEGKRDQEMYSELYGHGVDQISGYSAEQLKNEDGIIGGFNALEDRYGDDFIQNKRQEALYGERIVSKFGEWSTQTAKVKPIVHFVSGALGDTWRAGAQTILDFPARIWWRIRMFGKSIHGNFVTSVWDLTKFKFLSLFGSQDARDKFAAKAKELGEMTHEYYKNKDGKEYAPSLGLYLTMPFARLKEHWQNIWDPKAALERKSDPSSGFLKRVTKEEREADPTKTFSNGYVDPNSIDDQREQARLAATDFTGPVCAGLGLFGTVVAGPLKIICGAAGIETGKSILCAADASRKSFSLINYVFRFIIPEMNAGSEYRKLEEQMKGEPNKAVVERYHALKSRYNNALLGMAMAAGNICEPILHLKRGVIGESKLGNFLVDSVIKFNDTFFLRFFSKRREVQGRLNYLNAAVQEKVGKQSVGIADYEKLNDDEFNRLMEGRPLAAEQEPGIIDSFIRGCVERFRGVKAAFSADEAYYQNAA